ncbi:MAG: hypothetical protein AAF557_27360 [Pseudomonadota bacterium]
MRRLLLAVMAAAIAGCTPAKKKPVVVAAPDLSDQLSVGCYTVDLFDPYRIEYPQAGVTQEHAKFLGVWKDGAWDGKWCHDLYITEVRADGTVTLLDAYGPNTARKWEAQVYKRTGRIVDGVLTFKGVLGAQLEYRLVGDGFMVGKRTDIYAKEQITLAKSEGVAFVPVPPRNPRRG